MNLTILNAIKQGWKPQEPGKRETYFCEAGCARRCSIHPWPAAMFRVAGCSVRLIFLYCIFLL